MESGWEPAEGWLHPLLSGGGGSLGGICARGVLGRVGGGWAFVWGAGGGFKEPRAAVTLATSGSGIWKRASTGGPSSGLQDWGTGLSLPIIPAVPCCVGWLHFRRPGKLLSSAVGGWVLLWLLLLLFLPLSRWRPPHGSGVAHQDGAWHSVPSQSSHQVVDAAHGSPGAEHCGGARGGRLLVRGPLRLSGPCPLAAAASLSLPHGPGASHGKIQRRRSGEDDPSVTEVCSTGSGSRKQRRLPVCRLPTWVHAGSPLHRLKKEADSTWHCCIYSCSQSLLLQQQKGEDGVGACCCCCSRQQKWGPAASSHKAAEQKRGLASLEPGYRDCFCQAPKVPTSQD